MDGNRTLGENICDSGGLAHSFTAYTNSKKEDGRNKKKEMRLPGVNYTDEQLFFITYGQVVNQIYFSLLLLLLLKNQMSKTDLVRSVESGRLREIHKRGAQSGKVQGHRSPPERPDLCPSVPMPPRQPHEPGQQVPTLELNVFIFHF